MHVRLSDARNWGVPMAIHLFSRSSRSLLAIGVSLAAFAAASAQEKQATESASAPSHRIQLAVDKIPIPAGPLAVFRLAAPKAPTEIVEELLREGAKEPVRLAPLSEVPQLAGGQAQVPEEILGAVREGSLAAYVNVKTGDAEVFPSFSQQKTVTEAQEGGQLERATSRAREFFARPDVLPRDATKYTLEKPRPVYGQTAEQAAGAEVKAGRNALYLTYVAVRRSVGEYYVHGPGSRALVAVGTDGTLQGFQRRWKAAEAAGEVRETRSSEQVAEAITAQLQRAAKSAEVEVLSTDIAYYDGHREYLQPVYRFTARIHELGGPKTGERTEKHVNDDFVIGYVPIGKPKEPVPSLLDRPTHGPVAPKQADTPKERPGDPTIGRYVVRDDDSNWVANANEFWGGLSSFSGNFLFTNSQYYWAYPFEFNTNEAAFVNSVNVADNEVHGDWWFFTTEKNCCDGVDITAIPASEGYGSAHGGKLDFWMLHSCEVVPSAIDAPCPTDSRPWWTPWFKMFQGLHTVVGYRTIMWIDDDVTGPFATSLRFGAPVVSAWFNATNSAAGYQGNPTYPAHCTRKPPMGRPSTVSVCGRQNDWIYDTSGLPPASCLINFWQPN